MATLIKRGKKPEGLGRWEPITFLPLLLRTSLTDGVGDIFDVGDWDHLTLILAITVSATDAGDTLDVKLDGSWDGSIFYNMCEFTQQAGTGSAAVEMFQFRSGGIVAYEDAVLVITADCGAAVSRPSMCPPYLRVTTTIARVTGTDEAHTFSVIGYFQ